MSEGAVLRCPDCGEVPPEDVETTASGYAVCHDCNLALERAYYDHLPDGWEWSGGEAVRPLHEGGYYLSVAIKTIWENQYKRRYYEARIDCSDYTSEEGPRQHHVEITEREEDLVAGDSHEVRSLYRDSIDVDERNDAVAQAAAEATIHRTAYGLMEEIND